VTDAARKRREDWVDAMLVVEGLVGQFGMAKSKDGVGGGVVWRGCGGA